MQSNELTQQLIGADVVLPSETELLWQAIKDLQEVNRSLREEVRVLLEDQPMKWR